MNQEPKPSLAENAPDEATIRKLAEIGVWGINDEAEPAEEEDLTPYETQEGDTEEVNIIRSAE